MAVNFPSLPTTGQTYVQGGVTWTYDGAKWTAYPGGMTIPDAPSDGQLYGRKQVSGSMSWAVAGGIADAPSDGLFYGRANGAWASGGMVSGNLIVNGSISVSSNGMYLYRASFVITAVTASGPTTLSYTAGEVQKISITANCSFSVSGWPTSGNFARMVLDITNTGAFTVSGWPAGIKWAGGSAPVITSGAGKRDVIILMTLDGGTTVLGSIAGQDYR